MATGEGKVTIINLRDGGTVELQFPEKIDTDDRSNWQSYDVANKLKPLSFGNVEPQKVTLDELCLDNTRTNANVEPTIDLLREWMRPGLKPTPPPLMVVTKSWRQRCVLTELRVSRTFYTKEGVCIRAYLTPTFEELRS